MAALKIGATEFETLLQGDKPLLVDYWAPWCGDCRRIEGAYDQIAQQYGADVTVAKVDIDQEPELAAREKIVRIPTLRFYRGGAPVNSVVEPQSRAEIEAFLNRLLGRAEADGQGDATVYDMVVIGGGPGGYTAALYGARAGFSVLVLERLSAGGQMAQTHWIDNYPGFAQGVDGFALAQQMQQQAERFGARTEYADVTGVELRGPVKEILAGNAAYYGRTVVYAAGAGPRELGLPEEEDLKGLGLSYCAVCDGAFYRGKTVVVVGGGNSAVTDAIYLSRMAERVILVHRRDTLRASKIYHEQLLRAENVEMRWNSVVTAILHGDTVNGVRLRDTRTGEETELSCHGVFVSVGRKPATDLVRGQVTLDEGGYILADESTKTNLPGVYAVGDVRRKPLRQVVTAVSDGAVAVHQVEEYLAEAETL